jgi:hypothetical protein
MVYSTQTVHLCCVKINTMSEKDPNELPLEPHHLVVTSSASKTISKPMVCLAQTMHLSCTTLTLSPNGKKRDSAWPTSPRCSIGCIQNNFLNLWYVQSKLCTYLTLGLAVSSNRPKWAFTWALSLQSTIGCIQNDFWADGTFGTNCAPILHWH